MRTNAWIAALALSAGLGTACLADITGKVTITGKIPDMEEIKVAGNPDCAKMHKDPIYEEKVVAGDKGELANVVVSIKAPAGKELTGGKPAPAVLDQKGCVYVPHVVALQVGQSIVTKNSDAVMHNVHTLPIDNDPVNSAMTGGAPPIKIGPYKAVEDFKVKCDVHPWMNAWIRVVDSPFYAVTGADGTYTIDTTGLADGEYELVFWQEMYREQTKKITVKGGKATADAVYNADKKAEGPAAAPGRAAVVTLAEMVQKTAGTSAVVCDDCCDVPAKATAVVTAAKAK